MGTLCGVYLHDAYCTATVFLSTRVLISHSVITKQMASSAPISKIRSAARSLGLGRVPKKSELSVWLTSLSPDQKSALDKKVEEILIVEARSVVSAPIPELPCDMTVIHRPAPDRVVVEGEDGNPVVLKWNGFEFNHGESPSIHVVDPATKYKDTDV